MTVMPRLSAEERAYFQRCASIRRTSVTNLYGKLIEVIARDQIVLAVLDDDSKPFDGRPFSYRSGPLSSV
jgi:hypothetical protein